MAVRRLPVAVGILAKNEAADLPDCLRQCDFAHETIVLVDTASTDDTEAIARAAGATVLRQTLRSFAEARNAVLEHHETLCQRVRLGQRREDDALGARFVSSGWRQSLPFIRALSRRRLRRLIATSPSTI